MPDSQLPDQSDVAHSESTNSSVSTMAFVLPLVVFLIVAQFYPDFAQSYADDGWGKPVKGIVTPETWKYLVMVAAQVVIATTMLCYFWKTYLRQFPLRISPLSVVVGAVGVVVWIFLASLGVEHHIIKLFGGDASRPSFNPFTIEDTLVRAAFLGFRFTLLAVLVPLVEELFLRGWLVRWVDDPDFEKVRYSQLTWKALLAASVYGVLTHPGEAIAAFVWFGMVTWLMRKTGSLWDCVVAHAVTNLLLGIYILKYSQWQLW